MKNLCVIPLPGECNYAVVSPQRIVYALDASRDELQQLETEEKELLQHGIPSTTEYETEVPLVVDSLAVIVTHDCNLRCIYCYALGGDTAETVVLPIAKTTIEHIHSKSSATHFDLYLVGGGEPLLPFDLVSNLVDWLENQYESATVHVVSNGTFPPNVCEWLIEKSVSIRLSFDGVMQNIQRPFQNGTDSSDVVKRNIRRLVMAGAEPTIQCIITQEGLSTLRDTIDLAVELGVKTIKLEPALTTDISRGDGSMRPDPKKFARKLLEVIRYVAKKSIDFKIDTGFFGEPNAEFYCGMPDDNMILTPHGQLTACVEIARPEDPFADTIIYGTATDIGIKIDTAAREILEKLHIDHQEGGCRSCNLRLICRGGCPMANIWESGLPIRKSQYTCAIEKILLPQLLLDIVTSPGVANVVLDHGSNIC